MDEITIKILVFYGNLRMMGEDYKIKSSHGIIVHFKIN